MRCALLAHASRQIDQVLASPEGSAGRWRVNRLNLVHQSTTHMVSARTPRLPLFLRKNRITISSVKFPDDLRVWIEHDTQRVPAGQIYSMA
jgi:hypothetical protein